MPALYTRRTDPKIPCIERCWRGSTRWNCAAAWKSQRSSTQKTGLARRRKQRPRTCGSSHGTPRSSAACTLRRTDLGKSIGPSPTVLGIMSLDSAPPDETCLRRGYSVGNESFTVLSKLVRMREWTHSPGVKVNENRGCNEPLNCVVAERPLVIGHRGFCSIAPENTLPSFELAISAGADLVELDYRHTADGVPVVIHDAELDRTTDAQRRWKERHVKVAAKTVAQIKSLDAGSWFDAKYAGAKVPTLAEALDAIFHRPCSRRREEAELRGFHGRPPPHVGGYDPLAAAKDHGPLALIERKAGDPATCLGVLRETRLIKRVIVQSFDWDFLRALHE